MNDYFLYEFLVLASLYADSIFNNNNNNKNKTHSNASSSSYFTLYKNAISLFYQNFLIFFDLIVNVVFKENKLNNVYLNKSNNVILTNLSKLNKRIQKNEHFNLIKINNESILNFIKNNLSKFCNEEISKLIKNLNYTPLNHILDYFKLKILKNYRIATRAKNISINLFSMNTCSINNKTEEIEDNDESGDTKIENDNNYSSNKEYTDINSKSSLKCRKSKYECYFPLSEQRVI